MFSVNLKSSSASMIVQSLLSAFQPFQKLICPKYK